MNLTERNKKRALADITCEGDVYQALKAIRDDQKVIDKLRNKIIKLTDHCSALSQKSAEFAIDSGLAKKVGEYDSENDPKYRGFDQTYAWKVYECRIMGKIYHLTNTTIDGQDYFLWVKE